MLRLFSKQFHNLLIQHTSCSYWGILLSRPTLHMLDHKVDHRRDVGLKCYVLVLQSPPFAILRSQRLDLVEVKELRRIHAYEQLPLPYPSSVSAELLQKSNHFYHHFFFFGVNEYRIHLGKNEIPTTTPVARLILRKSVQWNESVMKRSTRIFGAV